MNANITNVQMNRFAYLSTSIKLALFVFNINYLETFVIPHDKLTFDLLDRFNNH